jgi:hypothetical protein
MISGLLAGAAQLGLAGLALKRVAIRIAAGAAVGVFSLGLLLIAVTFAAIAAFLALETLVPPAGAALIVAAGLLVLVGLILLLTWLVLRRGAAKAAPLPGLGGANPIHLALGAFGAGLAAGNAMFRRRR